MWYELTGGLQQVLAVFISFMFLLKLVGPEWKEVFLGLVPSKVCPV